MVWTKSICLLIVINSCALSIPLGKKQRQGKFLSIFSLVSFEVREGLITIWSTMTMRYVLYIHYSCKILLHFMILLQNTICNGTSSTTADNPICIDQGKFLYFQICIWDLLLICLIIMFPSLQLPFQSFIFRRVLFKRRMW